MQMMLKCEFWKKKIIFVNRVTKSYFRPFKANKKKYNLIEVLL